MLSKSLYYDVLSPQSIMKVYPSEIFRLLFSKNPRIEIEVSKTGRYAGPGQTYKLVSLAVPYQYSGWDLLPEDKAVKTDACYRYIPYGAFNMDVEIKVVEAAPPNTSQALTLSARVEILSFTIYDFR